MKKAKKPVKKKQHELVPFLAIFAVEYARSYELDGIHPRHYRLMKKYGARLDNFKPATNARATSK